MMLATQKGQGRPLACPQNDEGSGLSPGSWRPRSSSVFMGMMAGWGLLGSCRRHPLPRRRLGSLIHQVCPGAPYAPHIARGAGGTPADCRPPENMAGGTPAPPAWRVRGALAYPTKITSTHLNIPIL